MRQASALSPLSPIMFIVVIELVSRKVSVKDNQRKLLYADDLAVIVESKQEMLRTLSSLSEQKGEVLGRAAAKQASLKR